MRASGGFGALLTAQGLSQQCRQAITVHPVPGLGRHPLAGFLQHPDFGQLAAGGQLLLGRHPGLTLPAVLGALLLLPEPPIAALGGRRAAQEERLAEEDGPLDANAGELGKHGLIGHRTPQQRRQHGGGDAGHAPPPC